MQIRKQLVYVVIALLLLTVLSGADDLRLGVAIITDGKSEILMGEEYNRIVENAYYAFHNAYVPAVIVEGDYLEASDLRFVDAVVIVGASALNADLAPILEDFIASGGVLAATFDSGLYDMVGDKIENPWLPQLMGLTSEVSVSDLSSFTIVLEDEVVTYSGRSTLAVPQANATALGVYQGIDGPAPFVKTDNTIYAAMDLFASENYDLEQFFIDQVLEMVGKNYFGMIAMDYEDIKELANETRSLLRSAQREYRKTSAKRDLGARAAELYEESQLWYDALSFAVRTRSSYHLPRYVTPASKIGAELYDISSYTEIPYATLKARGSHYENRVNLFANETVPNNPIVFIGDSLTEAFNFKKYFPDLPIINRGISADVISGAWDRRHLLGLEKNPTKVFMMLGINNVTANIQLPTYLEDMEKVLLYIKETVPGAEIYVQSICPLARNYYISPYTIQNLNAELQKLAAKHGFTYVDIYSSMADESGYLKEELTRDGVHFTTLGYDVWASVLKQYLY